MCAKKDEHNTLLDGDRRTPGPNIDGVFIIPTLNKAELFLIELSDGPAVEDFELYYLPIGCLQYPSHVSMHLQPSLFVV